MHTSLLIELLLLLLQMKRLKWCCRENAAGAIYKIITREKLVNVSKKCGRIEMSSAGVWMERGRHRTVYVVDIETLPRTGGSTRASGNPTLRMRPWRSGMPCTPWQCSFSSICWVFWHLIDSLLFQQTMSTVRTCIRTGERSLSVSERC